MMAHQVTHSFEGIDLAGVDFAGRYRLLSSSIIPRPIAFVSTLNEDGTLNAAPFSSFMIASVEAALLAFSVGPSEVPKVTLQNVIRSGEYVINTVSMELAREVQICGEEREPGVSKVVLASLHGIASKKINTPRITETKVQFECGLRTIIPFGKSHMVVGEVLMMHVRDGLLRDEKIDVKHYAPLGRIAGRSYCPVTDVFSV
jgi:flavin reductase (DIM6/NTAB) family NADH-FMN oxidoreductase RutF